MSEFSLEVIDAYGYYAHSALSLQLSQSFEVRGGSRTFSDALIVVDWSNRGQNRAMEYVLGGRPSVFVSHEPSVVHPRAHHPGFTDLFTKVFRLGFPAGGELQLQYPVRHSGILPPSKEPIRRAVMVNTNLYSLLPGELYSLRRKASRLGIVDTFGAGWKPQDSIALRTSIASAVSATQNRIRINWSGLSAPHTALFAGGPVIDKMKHLNKYKVTLAIENSLEYTSEKLMEPILAGSIPVYVGSRHITDRLPEGLVFCANDSLASVTMAISDALTADFEKWLTVRDEFLASPQFRDFIGVDSYLGISRAVRKIVDSQRTQKG